jgi:hypothetical protein
MPASQKSPMLWFLLSLPVSLQVHSTAAVGKDSVRNTATVVKKMYFLHKKSSEANCPEA